MKRSRPAVITVLFIAVLGALGLAAWTGALQVQGKLSCLAPMGVPGALWLTPPLSVMGWLCWPAHRRDDRGIAAQRALVILAPLTVLGAAVVAWSCPLGVGLLAASVVALAAALTPAEGRRPGLPDAVDRIAALIIGVTVTGVAFQLALILGARHDRVTSTAAGPPPTQGLDVQVQTELRPSRLVTIDTTPVDVALDGLDPSRGPQDAPVTVVFFGDLASVSSARQAQVLAALQADHPDDLRIVFKQFPRSSMCNSLATSRGDPGSCRLARASMCAHRQGRFWPFYDALMSQRSVAQGFDLLGPAAAASGVDLPALQACLLDPAIDADLLEDLGHAGYAGVVDAPTTVIDGAVFRGATSVTILDAVVRRALSAANVQGDGRLATYRRVVTDAAPPRGPVAPVRVGTVHMDAVEAHIDDQGVARAIVGAVPSVVSAAEAAAACERRGATLCGVAVWRLACSGQLPVDDDGDGSILGDWNEGRLWPYGAPWRAGWCADGVGGAGRSGSHPACRTPEGIYDLTGNVTEWVLSDGEAVAVGGGTGQWDAASCARFDTSAQKAGVRCCAVPSGLAEGQGSP